MVVAALVRASFPLSLSPSSPTAALGPLPRVLLVLLQRVPVGASNSGPRPRKLIPVMVGACSKRIRLRSFVIEFVGEVTNGPRHGAKIVNWSIRTDGIGGEIVRVAGSQSSGQHR